ncbi:Angio-associated migratory cell protein [Spatholobus suberectus]|nr:Angio-associated migratory cell protein [Spatholobus suberectus]
MHAPGSSPLHDDEDNNDGAFLDESDIIDELLGDSEVLPDVDDISESDCGMISPCQNYELLSFQCVIIFGSNIVSTISEEEGGGADFKQKFTAHARGLHLDEADITHEISMDSEDLSNADDDSESECGMSRMGLCSVAYSPTNATLVATEGRDNKGFPWKISKVEDRAIELHGHKNSVASLAFSYDGQLVASGCLDGNIKVWDVSGGLDGIVKVWEWLKWHPRGHILLAGFEDSHIWMWNTDKAALLNAFIGHGGSVTCGDFTPDGRKIICTGSNDATLRIWNPKSGENIHVVGRVYHPYHTEGLTCLAINSTSTLALTGSEDGSVHTVNITKGRVRVFIAFDIHYTFFFSVLVLSSVDSWAAIGRKDKKLIIWDIEHSLPRDTCEHEDGVTCLAWLSASYVVATGCMDGKVRLWDSRSGECVKTFKGHSRGIASLSVSANKDFLVLASYDEQLVFLRFQILGDQSLLYHCI